MLWLGMGPSAKPGIGASSKGPSRRSVGLISIAVLALASLLAACGGSSHKKQTTTTTRARTTSTTTSGPAQAHLRGITTFSYLEDEDFYSPSPWRVTIYDLRRWGPYVTLDFGAKCLDKSGCEGNAFYDPNRAGGAPGDMTLIDTTNNVEYLPVTDSQGREYVSQAPSADLTTPFTLMWVTFPAPPTSVTSLDLTFREGGPEVPNIPITTASSGPTPSQVGGKAQAAPPSAFDKPPGSPDTTGLTLQKRNLALKIGNPNGNDTESPGHSTLTLSADVLFHFNKSDLTPKARTVLSQVAVRIKRGATGTVSVDGYTDSIGTDAVNLPLSRARAHSVVTFLGPATSGAPVTYHGNGHGAADPVAPNTLPSGADDPAGRALNRRVTISYNVKQAVKPTPPVAATAPAAATGTASSRSAKFTIDNGPTTGTYLATADALFRTGDMLVLRFSLKCLSVTGSNTCDGIVNLAGDNSIPPFPGYKAQGGMTLRALGNVYLRDTDGNDYIPVYTPVNGQPATAQVNQFIGGSPFPLWAYYPAPPPSVTSMTVVLPGGQAKIADVPISDSAPPLS
jgi:outer membrane protein OmpA-like peptidoglycan-associated protein